MSRRGSSVFGPVALIALGVLLLIHNLVDGYSFWTPLLDHWPWFLVAWGAVHVVQNVIARSNGSPPPARLSGGAVLIALLICLVGVSGRTLRENNGVLFRGFGVRVQVRDSGFRLPSATPQQSLAAPQKYP